MPRSSLFGSDCWSHKTHRKVLLVGRLTQTASLVSHRRENPSVREEERQTSREEQSRYPAGQERGASA